MNNPGRFGGGGKMGDGHLKRDACSLLSACLKGGRSVQQQHVDTIFQTTLHKCLMMYAGSAAQVDDRHGAGN